MSPPFDATDIAARIEAGEDLSPADEAAWLAYLEQNPAAAVELDEQLGQLRRLVGGAEELPEVSAAEWAAVFERITAAAAEPAPEPPAEAPEPAPPRLPAGGLLMLALLVITAGFIAFQLREQAPPDPVGSDGPPPQSPTRAAEAPLEVTPFIGPLPEGDGSPDIEIEDLQVGEDIQATLRLPLKRGSFTLIRLRKKPR